MAPIIGITTNDRSELYFKLREEYVDAVRRAGGVPVLLPPGETRLAELLAGLHGLVFSGGVDIDPALYNGNGQHPTLSPFQPGRDSFELALVHHSMALNIPALYICRGAQLLNVALGGSLMEHLPDEVGSAVTHRLPPRNPTAHTVQVESESRLAEVLGQTEVTSASWHHQALKQVAPGLRVVALAPDGIIEAVEMPQHQCLLAVQWHPELTAATDSTQQRLFDWLVNSAQTYAAQRLTGSD